MNTGKDTLAFAKRSLLTALDNGLTLEDGMKHALKREMELYKLLFVKTNNQEREELRQAIMMALAAKVYAKLRGEPATSA